MKRPVVVVLLTLSLLTQSCTNLQPSLPADEDPDQLVEEIVQRGKGEAPPAPPPPEGTPVLGYCLKTSARVTATCAVLALYGAIVVGAAASHGSISSGQQSGSGLGDMLKQIWTD
jgi:hypothetical protein